MSFAVVEADEARDGRLRTFATLARDNVGIIATIGGDNIGIPVAVQVRQGHIARTPRRTAEGAGLGKMPLPSFRYTSFRSGESLLTTISRLPSWLRSAKAAEYVRSGALPRLLPRNPPCPSFNRTRLNSGQCRPSPKQCRAGHPHSGPHIHTGGSLAFLLQQHYPVKGPQDHLSSPRHLALSADQQNQCDRANNKQ